MNIQEARNAWAYDSARLAAAGIVLGDVVTYATDEMKLDYTIAMDAVPAGITSANAGIPAFLTTTIDPQVIKVLFAPNKAAQIFGEVKKGTWVDETAMFPVVEHTGEVSSYGDFSNNGRSGANMNFPQRQAYHYQTVVEVGDREIERVGLTRVNYVAELDTAAATVLNKFSNLTYFYGVAGLQNYGLLNDPSLSASLTPATKSAGNGNVWIYSGAPNATANEVYADIQALFVQLVTQSGGLIQADSVMTLALSPSSAVALNITNSFGITVLDIIKKNYPNLKVETAVQYGAYSATNPQGVKGGNFAQLIAGNVEGQDTGFCAFTEKMRAFPIVRDMSSWKKKLMSGSWGAVIRQPFAIASMIGV